MPDVLRINEKVEIPVDELMWRFSRASGPGGQHVNKADTRVELLFDVSATRSLSRYLRERVTGRVGGEVISVVVSESRSQFRNRQLAEKRFVELLAEALRPPPPPRRPTKPTRASAQRRVDDKKRRGAVKRNRRSGPRSADDE
jgi:ribosome-associated protein